MSIRTASQSPSTLTGKLQAQYVTHKPSPYPHPPPECSRSLTQNAKKPRVGGAELGRNEYHTAVPDECEARVSTTLQYQTSVRLAPPLRQRCDGHHKNALFCQVLQKVCACMTARPVAGLLFRTDALPSCHRGRVREARAK